MTGESLDRRFARPAAPKVLLAAWRVAVSIALLGLVFLTTQRLSVRRGLYSVRIRPYGASLIPGTSAIAKITVKTLRGTFVVPESALVKDPDTGGKCRKVEVRIALQSGKRIAITGRGLRDGERVVTEGAYELLPFASGNGNS